MSSVISTLNAAYHVRESRSWLRMRLIALVLTFAIPVLLFTAMFILLMGGTVVDWVGVTFNLRSVVLIFWKGLQSVSAVLFRYPLVFDDLLLRTKFGEASLALVYARLNCRHPSMAGRFLRVSGYLYFFNTYSSTYGSFGAVMILLISFYVMGFAFLGRRGDQRYHRARYNRE